VLAWVVHPMTEAHLADFELACRAGGKRLCTPQEWFAACSGPDQTPYVYGTNFDAEACNCVDTYCDDYCIQEGIPASSCDTAPNCGYTYDCFHQNLAGAHERCTNGYGTFDMNGNLWEVVPSSSDPRGYELRGGAFNCASAAARVNCSFNAGWTDLYAGFRCCRDRS
jgi:sulfatase modifying factor 1